MAEPETIHLFSYGTLRLPEVQMAVFGRLIEGEEDALSGWRTEMVEITDPDVLAKSGERFHPITLPSADPADIVAGTVFRVTEADIWAADAYEVSDYVRTSVRLRSGLFAWTYVHADKALADPPLDALIAAEARGLALLDAIEAAGLIAPGRSDLDIEHDIRALATRDFGVTTHWHDRIVRVGENTLFTAGQLAPHRTVAEDDIVFLDLGPVFGDWEADIGRSYAVGADPEKHRLVADLETVFEVVRERFNAAPDVTGAELFDIAVAESEARGWRFGGSIAGHTVGPFPYARSPAGRDGGRVSPANTRRMRDPDQLGRPRHWILEIHLVEPRGTWGGFYERLLLP